MRKSRITLMDLRKILRSKRGETLMEGIVSILIFTILMAAVTLMLNWAQRETGETIREGQTLQALADDALTGRFNTENYDGELSAVPADEDNPFTLTITHIDNIELEEDERIPPIPIDGVVSTRFAASDDPDDPADEFVAFFVFPDSDDEEDENGDDDEEEDEDGEGEGGGDEP